MIITSQKALRIVANPAVLKVVPELLMSVEKYREVDRTWQAALANKSCSNCKKAQFFGKVEDHAINAIDGLPKDAIQRLKTFLNANELYLNRPQPGKPGSTKRLDS